MLFTWDEASRPRWVGSSRVTTHFSKPLLCAVTYSFACFLKSLPVSRVGQVTYNKMWLWSLAPNMLASQGFSEKATELREVLQLKLEVLFLVKDTRSGHHFGCVMESGGRKGAAANPAWSSPASQAIPLSPVSPQLVRQLFPEQSMLQH